ncbi:hypothetical protein [Halobacillus yeomjeoni]|uniref:Uncharacterized protein n=1 Tax=Halobacillus yeomjeoni TaxID=311194 RepID=A0A931HXS2_9BACI|nr:hypothetical protein [Halobacillus yeomjeoni]MBH0231370.1 hypothetical protein [Halobacillus yeomjeoni]
MKGVGTIIKLTSIELLLGGVYETMHTGGLNITGQLITILLVFGLPLMLIATISYALMLNRKINILNKKIDRLASGNRRDD